MKNSVKEVRVEAGFTQQALADELSVSRQTIISIETGKYIPSTLLALKLAKALNRKVEELFVLQKGD